MSKRKHAIEAHFQSGVRLHGAGRLQEAEQVYRQIIAANPGHADSLHMLGVIASQCGQPEAAVTCIERAIALKPSAALYHVNRASALLALGRLRRGRECLPDGTQIQAKLRGSLPGSRPRPERSGTCRRGSRGVQRSAPPQRGSAGSVQQPWTCAAAGWPARGRGRGNSPGNSEERRKMWTHWAIWQAS